MDNQTVPKKRGRPPKSKPVEINTKETSYEFNTALSCGFLIDTNFDGEEIP